MSDTIGIKLEGGKLASAKKIKLVSKSLMQVLQSNTDEKTKRAALDFFKSSIKADGASNCSFNNISLDMDNSIDDSLTINKESEK